MALTAEFDFSAALYVVDARRAYGETRIIALGYIGDRLHVLIFTKRGSAVRVISLRKANKKEERTYHDQT